MAKFKPLVTHQILCRHCGLDPPQCSEPAVPLGSAWHCLSKHRLMRVTYFACPRCRVVIEIAPKNSGYHHKAFDFPPNWTIPRRIDER